MEKLKIIVFSFTLLSFVSCAAQNSQKFYKAVVENDENTPKEHFPELGVHYHKNEFKGADKKIFDLLKEQLKEVNHIYYGYLPQELGVDPTLILRAFVYDVDNDRFYFLEQQLDDDPEAFQLVNELIEYDYYRANFIIKNLKNNDCKSIQDAAKANFNISGQVVYDINLKENTIKRCSFNYLYLFKEYIKSIKKSND